MANRIRISQIIIVDIAARIHIPRIVIATTTVTRHNALYQCLYSTILKSIFFIHFINNLKTFYVIIVKTNQRRTL